MIVMLWIHEGNSEALHKSGIKTEKDMIVGWYLLGTQGFKYCVLEITQKQQKY